jgi:hypothetical protein
MSCSARCYSKNSVPIVTVCAKDRLPVCFQATAGTAEISPSIRKRFGMHARKLLSERQRNRPSPASNLMWMRELGSSHADQFLVVWRSSSIIFAKSGHGPSYDPTNYLNQQATTAPFAYNNAKRLPQSGFVQVAKSLTWVPGPTWAVSALNQQTCAGRKRRDRFIGVLELLEARGV